MTETRSIYLPCCISSEYEAYLKTEQEKADAKKQYEIKLKDERQKVLKAAHEKAQRELRLKQLQEREEARVIAEKIVAEKEEKDRKRRELLIEMRVRKGYGELIVENKDSILTNLNLHFNS